MNPPSLTLYFDGNCPFCRTQMAKLRRWDDAGRLAFVDIATPGFDPAPLGASMDDLNREVYSRRADGRILIGIDTMLAAYPMVGRRWRVLPLRVPLLRQACAFLYRQFARHRYTISRWLGYRLTGPANVAAAACSDGVCELKNPFLKK